MKIAKKLLAAVVAMMLVCSLSVCAFASYSYADGKVAIESDWEIDSYGSIAVKVYFTDAVDLKSWNLALTYDAAIFDFDTSEAGADADAVKNQCDSNKNSFTDESNPNVDGEIEVGGYFKEALWTAEEFLAASKRGQQCVVNADKFEANIFYLKVVDVAAFENSLVTISIAGDMEFDEKKSVSDTIDNGYVPSIETTTDPTTQPTTQPTTEPTTQPTTEPTTQPTTEPTTQPTTEPITEPATRPIQGKPDAGKPDAGKPDHDDCQPGKPGHDNCKPGKPVCKPIVRPGKPGFKHPGTGDSAALAAAAGVVLLAGAAFVVSKKRK